MKRFPKTFVQLGRAGDILNILPLVKREFQKHRIRPRVMVAADFAGILDGVKYADPLIWPGRFEDVKPAVWTAGRQKGDLIIPQIYGNDWSPAALCTSFARDSWRVAGADVPWGSLPLEFDRRDREGEQMVLRHFLILPASRPFVLLAVDGISSPFTGARSLKALLNYWLKDFRIIDLSGFRARHISDLIPLFDRAHCLVTIDAGLLHLAHASRVPVVTLVESRPSRWHGSAWRPNHVARFLYEDFPACDWALVDAVMNARTASARPTIIHAWTEYRGQAMDDDTARRTALARKSWAAEYQTGYWVDRRFSRRDSGRDSRGIGDPRGVPYVRDVIKHALAGAKKPSDIIALTNADVCFTPGLTGWILQAVRRHGAAFAHRWDFDRLDRLCLSEADVMTRAKFYVGTDAFFFTAEWWKTHGAEFPDMLIGREHWDEVFRQLIKRYFGVQLTGAIYHERHPSFWERIDQHATNRGNWHNTNLTKAWFARTGYRPMDPEWWKVPIDNF